MDFFKKSWVKVTCWVFVAVGALGLILGGTPVADIAKIPSLIFGIVEAVGLLIKFIISRVENKSKVTNDKKKKL